MTRILLFLILISSNAHAYETTFEVDFSRCGNKDCYAIFQKKILVDKDLEILFWSDVVDPQAKGYPRFYPLFNILNRTQASMGLHIEVELQDGHKVTLGSSAMDTEIIPQSKTNNQQDIYRSINAIELPNGNYYKAKYVRLKVVPK